MCYRTAQSLGAARGRVLNSGILILGAPPLLILTGFAILCYFVGGALRFIPDELELLYAPEFLLYRVLPVAVYFVALHLLYFASGDWFSSEK